MQQESSWTIHRCIKHLRKTLTFSAEPIQNQTIEPPSNATPTEVIHTNKETIIVARPAESLDRIQLSPTEPPWYRTAFENFTHITGEIKLLMADDDIISLIQSKSFFEFASDGGHDPTTGISSFGWVAAINKTVIAQGRGPVQCHPKLAESFRAEGYGIASVGLFARNLINKLGIDTQKHIWLFYLDNKSMIQRLEGYATINTPKWNLRPDEDITRLAHSILQRIPFQLEHIKSHQDTDSQTEKLSFPAVLNIVADEQATRQRNLMTGPEGNVTNLQMYN
jgi:hypothetical protein